ncbi:AraC family transcriptional regulator [Sporocytophaga myxococcoides]|uniref:AraC family transcriptional regulator n=2 Tax=Sporocytophaga myxococcoides TaxID=153721 RepID=A0A098LG91_9BACT|nr:AraC family transcriptional regulator [Sporocytophaga myxococcoides]
MDIRNMKNITIVVPDCGVNLNSIGGAFEILRRANDFWIKTGNESRLEIHIAGFMRELKAHESYLAIHPIDIRTIQRTNLVIIPSLIDDFSKVVNTNRALIDWIYKQYQNGAEVASICSGAFLLAATGLLNGKSCSIHWNKAVEFKRMFPEIKVAEDKIITDENGIYTNGGAYSFLNLILYLVEKIFDRSVAVYCSKVFQIDMERTAQSHFTIFNIQKGHGDELIGKAQTYIEENIDAKISFENLASELAISRRSFDRRFIKATGNTPMEYLQRVKVEAAKKELEKGRKSIFEIMTDVGYADDKAFREVFRKITGLSPAEYRNKYNRSVA